MQRYIKYIKLNDIKLFILYFILNILQVLFLILVFIFLYLLLSFFSSAFSYISYVYILLFILFIYILYHISPRLVYKYRVRSQFEVLETLRPRLKFFYKRLWFVRKNLIKPYLGKSYLHKRKHVINLLNLLSFILITVVVWLLLTLYNLNLIFIFIFVFVNIIFLLKYNKNSYDTKVILKWKKFKITNQNVLNFLELFFFLCVCLCFFNVSIYILIDKIEFLWDCINIKFSVNWNELILNFNTYFLNNIYYLFERKKEKKLNNEIKKKKRWFIFW